MRSNVPNDIYEMELMGDNRFMVAVPISADMELKRRIMGAIKSHFHGSAVDPCIKKFGARWSISTPEELQLFVVATLRMIDRLAAEIVRAIEQGEPRPDHSGLLAAEVALVRLQPTFRSALILVSQAYAFEAAAMVRLILEQVSWAYAVHSLPDEKSVARVSTTGAISLLKRELPYVGLIYGYLTKRAHIDPTLTHTYFHASADGLVEISHQMSKESFVVLGHLLAVLTSFEHVTASTLGQYIRIPRAPSFLQGKPTLRDNLNAALQRLVSEHPMELRFENGPFFVEPRDPRRTR